MARKTNETSQDLGDGIIMKSWDQTYVADDGSEQIENVVDFVIPASPVDPAKPDSGYHQPGMPRE